MNQLIKYFTLAIVLLGSTMTMSAQKIGYVNTGVLLSEIPAVKQANANLEALQKQLQKKGEGMVEELRGKYGELQRKEQQGELSPKLQEEEVAKLQAEEAKFQQYQQEMQGQLEEKRQTLIQPILDDLSDKIQEVAKENSYTYIMDDSGILLFKDPQFDVTDLVRKKLGL